MGQHFMIRTLNRSSGLILLIILHTYSYSKIGISSDSVLIRKTPIFLLVAFVRHQHDISPQTSGGRGRGDRDRK